MQNLKICRTLSASVVAFSIAMVAQETHSAPYQTLAMAASQSPPATPADKRALNAVDSKLHAQLRAADVAHAAGSPDASGLPTTLRNGNQLLVEVGFGTEQTLDEARGTLLRHGATPRNALTSSVNEAWVPLDRLRELAADASVQRIVPARLARHLATTSQGVAAGNADYWHTFNPSYTGTGITVAVIDGYDKAGISALQSSADWPPGARLSCYDVKDSVTGPPYAASSCTAGNFGNLGNAHGNATMEIVYDVASGSTYRGYDAVTVGDWYNAILDAANIDASGTALGAVRASVIVAALAAPNDGIGDGSALAGSIAEAAGFARNRGVLVVNAAGNERQNHWGGAYTPASGDASHHSWSGSNTLYNFFSSGGAGACLPPGTTINISMYWNNWLKSGSNFVANHDYDLYLFQALNSTTWNSLSTAQSNQPQNGAVGNTPQEAITYTTVPGATTTGCATNSAVYGITVVRTVGTTANDNLQVFADAQNGTASYPLNYQVAARSLAFPADSPNVLSVAAIDVANATTSPQEPFSSEGPVLATGGDIPFGSPSTDPNLKPDLASFDHVSTATHGASAFFGTSVAAAHVAGMAALFMQRFGIQTTAANLSSAIVTPLRAIANTGSNDLGAIGKDYQYGNGRLRFQKDTSLAFIQQPVNTLVNTNITPAIKIGIYDSEAKLDSYTLFNALTLAIANDPNGGAAVLSGGGSGNLVAGIATYATAKISLGGIGYTLSATASAASAPPINLVVTSNAFDITTGAATKLAFVVQPAAVVAGHAVSPAIKIGVEDSNGNVVNTDNTTSVTLMRTSCNGVVPVGGGPVTAVSGIATFANLTLFSAGNAALTATATGKTPATSATFAVSVNPDTIFRNGLETCSP
jgi:hypothetical protein